MSEKKFPIEVHELEKHLSLLGYQGAKILDLFPLGPTGQTDFKACGYGQPLRVHLVAGGREHHLVFRTLKADRFGHDRRADRFAQVVLARDTFGAFPAHVAAIDAGAIDRRGRLISLGDGEPYLLTEWVDGELYAKDLTELAGHDHARPRDLARARFLAEYLAQLHAEVAPAAAYTRSIRDTIGSGEGIFGLVDSYEAGDPIATPKRLEGIETACVRWRSHLRAFSGRSRRTHGDFHPFNILFREGTDCSVLDASRGSAGDPADDVSCLSINYLFFAWVRRGSFNGALFELWSAFWERYLERSKDTEVLNVVAPFFAWRALVLANPLWYPAVGGAIREKLLEVTERLLAGALFDPRAFGGL